MKNEEILPILKLAGPVMLSRIGAILIVTVDVAMCGYAGSKELAYYGLANGPHVSLILVGIGSILPIAILTAKSDGAGNHRSCGMILRVGLFHALLIGVVLGILMQFGEEFFLLTGQSEELSTGGGRVLAMHGLGLAGLLCMIAISLSLEGLQRPVPAMIVSIGVNFINIYLNWVFIFGNHGAPVMGAEGAALSTSITRWVAVTLLAGYVIFKFDHIKYGIREKITQFREISKNLRQLGNPTAIAHGMESTSFLILTLFAGYMGVIETAAWAIGLNVLTIAFMIALGFAMAASVRVANHLGRQRPHEATRSAWTAFRLAMVLLGLLALTFASFPEPLARIYSQDPSVLHLAVPMLLVGALSVSFDGLQAVGVGILRGYQDMWYITMTMICSFWVVMIPLAWLFGMKMGYGPSGLMASLFFACITALTMLLVRFRVLARRSESA